MVRTATYKDHAMPKAAPLGFTEPTSPLPVAEPESVGLSTAGLARLTARLRRDIERGYLPGTVALVARRGRVAYLESLGAADPAGGAAMAPDAIFRIYSMTKPITSTAFMMLVEEGKVALDEPVHKYIPEWKNLGVFQAGTYPAFLTKPPARPMVLPSP